MLSILRQRARKHFLLNTVRLRYKFSLNSKRTEYYFGYGANLSMDRFTSRKMNVQELGNAHLPDHEIRFTLSNEYKLKGYAGVHEAKGHQVHGVLCEMDKLSLTLLDTLEWCGFGAYERKKVQVVKDSDGSQIEAWCYFVKYPKEGLFPSKLYLTNMIKAAESRNFPLEYINDLKSHEYRENFEIDHGYSLLFYGQRRAFEKELHQFYKIHDKLREKLCDLI